MSKTTYNPIEGPLDSFPGRRPGAVVVMATNTGFVLHDPSVARQPLLPPSSEALPPMGEARPLNETLRLFGKGLFEGSKVLVEAAQSTSFGRKHLGGRPKSFYLVNISRQKIEMEFTLRSKEGTIYFIAKLSCDTKIIDPVRVVSEGMTDVAAHVENELKRRLSSVAATYSVSDLSVANHAMQQLLDADVFAADKHFDHLVRLERGLVHLELDEAAQRWLRQTQESSLATAAVRAEAEVAEAKRLIQHGIAGNPDQLLAAWLATGEARYKVALEEQLQSMQNSDAHKMELLRIFLEKGGIEAHELHARFPQLADSLLSRVIPGGQAQPALTGEAAPPAPPGSAPLDVVLPGRP